jgi:hypothetical protein
LIIFERASSLLFLLKSVKIDDPTFAGTYQKGFGAVEGGKAAFHRPNIFFTLIVCFKYQVIHILAITGSQRFALD